MVGKLRCYSVHSVKGGVGKSTLSTAIAHTLALRNPNTEVFLIDMDLTGTSLGDALPLEAPSWSEGQVDLLRPPDGNLSRDATLARIEERQGGPRDAAQLQVPYLNDFLLWADADWSTTRDVLPEALCWRLRGGPDKLRVLPSSALPDDLQRIIPVIFDEEYAAFLEQRVEALLAALVPDSGERIIVFDTPPTIPGLSRSIISLGLRLGGATKQALADDGYIPPALQECPITWRICVVITPDVQDLRPADRWMTRVSEEERPLVKVVINRAPPDRPKQLYEDLFGGGTALRTPQYATLANFADPRLCVPDDPCLQLFRNDDALRGGVDKILRPVLEALA